ncbi:hypothetical protein CAPTEDRAFT_192050 [Capitella teleta]|uniref:Uncharacterized protein n=1 Tax=Capitella teleta TaxID=283909 RepID=R7VHW1_CAPTE|nr:hypothetical protein CAPTEDRAFT_192050 [Capitella teleta]|eukprot:ELU18174.1 hypothetical protein CAPTEDRAFT_192050 [Capitella teleta]
MDDCSRPLTAIEEEHICLQQAQTSNGNLGETPEVVGRRRSVSFGQGAWAALRDTKGKLNMFVDGKDGRRTSMISVVGLAMFRKLYAAEMNKCRRRQKEDVDEVDEDEKDEKDEKVKCEEGRRRSSIISTMSEEAQKALQEMNDDEMD